MWSSPKISFIGSALFILYINDLCNVSTLLKLILFADDTNLLYSGKYINKMCSVVSIKLDKLCKWFHVNKLSLKLHVSARPIDCPSLDQQTDAKSGVEGEMPEAD